VYLINGAQVWAESIVGTKKSESLFTQFQMCAALKVSRCYRTVPDMATLVLAYRMPPAYLLVTERKSITGLKKTGAV